MKENFRAKTSKNIFKLCARIYLKIFKEVTQQKRFSNKQNELCKTDRKTTASTKTRPEHDAADYNAIHLQDLWNALGVFFAWLISFPYFPK